MSTGLKNGTIAPEVEDIIKYKAILVTDILEIYSKNIRPVALSRMPAEIKFGIQLNKLAALVRYN